MTRALVSLVVVLVSAATLVVGQEPTYRSDAHTVSVYATVLDEAGRLVSGLGRDDFEIYDNGTRQELSVFANDIQPITIVVMIDRSGSMASHFNRVRDAAEHFVATLLPADRARIGSFSDRVQIDPREFTSDKEELRRILHEKLLQAGLTPLWDATGQAMNALANHAGRRVVLLFTDGKDTPRFGRSVTFDSVRTRSVVEEVMVYGIGFSQECDENRVEPPPVRRAIGGGALFQMQARPQIPGTTTPGGRRPGMPTPGNPTDIPPPPSTIPGLPPLFPGSVDPAGVTPRQPANGALLTFRRCIADAPDPNLRELAAVGGGGYFELRSTDDLPSTFARVAEELHHQYLLAFVPAVLDNQLHRIEVRVRKPGLKPRARGSYMASRDK